jgi:hypothetical protein
MANAVPSKLKLQYQDTPELKETFSDGIGRCYFDGSTLRIEFVVTRLDKANRSDEAAGRVYPVCRLVLSPSGALDLLNKAPQIATAIKKTGEMVMEKARLNNKPATENEVRTN